MIAGLSAKPVRNRAVTGRERFFSSPHQFRRNPNQHVRFFGHARSLNERLYDRIFRTSKRAIVPKTLMSSCLEVQPQISEALQH